MHSSTAPAGRTQPSSTLRRRTCVHRRTFLAGKVQRRDLLARFGIDGHTCVQQHAHHFCVPILRGKVQRSHVINCLGFGMDACSGQQDAHSFLHQPCTQFGAHYDIVAGSCTWQRILDHVATVLWSWQLPPKPCHLCCAQLAQSDPYMRSHCF